MLTRQAEGPPSGPLSISVVLALLVAVMAALAAFNGYRYAVAQDEVATLARLAERQQQLISSLRQQLTLPTVVTHNRDAIRQLRMELQTLSGDRTICPDHGEGLVGDALLVRLIEHDRDTACAALRSRPLLCQEIP
ncbi:MAG TPA: hypothetical protein VM366_05480 [Anaerolineae bacterium]|nr:hypothetical protein [Anaerolineae bacterium]